MQGRILEHRTPDETNDGFWHVLEVGIVEVDEAGNETIIARHRFNQAVKVPESGQGRGQAISRINQTLASLRQDQGGKPDEIESMESELSVG